MSSPNGRNHSGPSTFTPTGQPSKDRPETVAQGGDFLTTAQGVRLPDTDNSLKAGERGPSLLEDFHLREKITYFDHERIPERVVHRARCRSPWGSSSHKGTGLSGPGGHGRPGLLREIAAWRARRRWSGR